MPGPIEDLAAAYYRRVEWTRAMPRLGRVDAVRGGAQISALPSPDLAEVNTRTKDPHYLCVATSSGLRPIKGPASWPVLRAMVKDLVIVSGVHPDDIVIASVDPRNPTADPVFRGAVEHLMWDRSDQIALDSATSSGSSE